MSDKKLKLDKQDIDNESENDSHIQEPSKEEKKPFENQESFSYSDGQRTLNLGSQILDVFQLCQLGSEFLGLKSPLKSKPSPSYTK